PGRTARGGRNGSRDSCAMPRPSRQAQRAARIGADETAAPFRGSGGAEVSARGGDAPARKRQRVTQHQAWRASVDSAAPYGAPSERPGHVSLGARSTSRLPPDMLCHRLGNRNADLVSEVAKRWRQRDVEASGPGHPEDCLPGEVGRGREGEPGVADPRDVTGRQAGEERLAADLREHELAIDGGASLPEYADLSGGTRRIGCGIRVVGRCEGAVHADRYARRVVQDRIALGGWR